MQIKNCYKRLSNNILKNNKGFVLVQTVIIFLILIILVTSLSYFVLGSYKRAHKSIEFNEKYYQLDAQAQKLVQAVDRELYGCEMDAIEYMQSEKYVIARMDTNKPLNFYTQLFFYNRWNEVVFKPSRVLKYTKDGKKDSFGGVDTELYNQKLNEFYNGAFNRLYYNRIYDKKNNLGNNIKREYMELLSKEEKKRYEVEINTNLKNGVDYAYVNGNSNWDRFDPEKDDIKITIFVKDKVANKMIEIELKVNIQVYDSIEQKKTISVKGNPITSYALISQGSINFCDGADINITGDMYAYGGVDINSSKIKQFGNLYTPSTISFNNYGGVGTYIIHPYKSNYKRDLKGKLYYKDQGTGQQFHINSIQFKDNHFAGVFHRFEKYIYSKDNEKSLFFEDCKGGNVYCDKVTSNLFDDTNSNLILDVGAITINKKSTDLKKTNIRVNNAKKIIYSDDVNKIVNSNERSKYYYINEGIFKYYFESKVKNGGVDIRPKKKGQNYIDDYYEISEFDDISSFVNTGYYDKLGASGITVYKDKNTTLNLNNSKSIKGIIYSKGNLTIKGNGMIKGAIISQGNITLDGNIKIVHDEKTIKNIYQKSGNVELFFRRGEIGESIYSYNKIEKNARARRASDEKHYNIKKWILK